MRIVAAFTAAFLVGGTAIFAVASIAGAALGVAELPIQWRAALAGVVLLLLAAIDVLARAASTYCPIGWRRQTPRVLLRRYRLTMAATLWGFDTGLMITTFRVAAISWGALCLTAVGLSPPWTGAAYGLGYTIPFVALLLRPALGHASRGAAGTDPGLERMLRLRGTMQGMSAALLTAGGAVLIGRSIL